MTEEKKTGKRQKLADADTRLALAKTIPPEDGTQVLCECGCRWEGPVGESELIDMHTKDNRWARVKVGHRVGEKPSDD